MAGKQAGEFQARAEFGLKEIGNLYSVFKQDRILECVPDLIAPIKTVVFDATRFYGRWYQRMSRIYYSSKTDDPFVEAYVGQEKPPSEDQLTLAFFEAKWRDNRLPEDEILFVKLGSLEIETVLSWWLIKQATIAGESVDKYVLMSYEEGARLALEKARGPVIDALRANEIPVPGADKLPPLT
jgi:hypothetical protein